MINELDGDDDPTVAKFIELSASDMDLGHERYESPARFGMDITGHLGASLADDEVIGAVDLPGTTKKKRRTTRKPQALNGRQRQSLAKKKHTDPLNTTRKDDV